MPSAKALHWLLALATDTLTWMGCHPKQGGEAFDALALLGQFKGVLVLTLEDGSPVHSFQTLIAQLQTIVRNTCCTPGVAADAPTFEIITTPNPSQKRALDLVDQIKL